MPLARALARLDLFRALLERAQQALERLGERRDALDLELVGHLVEVHAHLRQVLELAPGEFDILVEAAADLSMLAKCGQRLRWNGVDGVRADQLFAVVAVRVARILGRGARPQAALRPRAGFAQLLP